MAVAAYPKLESGSPEARKYAEELRTLAAALAENRAESSAAQAKADAYLRALLRVYREIDAMHKRRQQITAEFERLARDVCGRLEGIDPPVRGVATCRPLVIRR